MHWQPVRLACFLALWLIVHPSIHAQSGNVGTNFQAITLTDIANNLGFLVTPPDTQGAVGPNHIVATTNGGFRIYNKNGTAATNLQADTNFWSTALSNNGQSSNLVGLTDPRVIYDPLSQRWFAAIITTADTGNEILLARTNTADPTAGWKAVRFTNTNTSNGNPVFADFPTLGIDANGIYVGTNNFNSIGQFVNRAMYSLPKASLLADTATTTNLSRFENLGNTRGFTLHAITDFSDTAGNALVVSSVNNTTLGITSLSGTAGGGATISATTNVTIQNAASPPNALQPNAQNNNTSSVQLDTGDNRIGNSVYRVNDRLYIARHVNNGAGGSGIRFTVLNALNNAVIQETTIGTDGFFNFYPAVAVNNDGDVVIGFTRSGFEGLGSANNLYASSFAIVGTTNNNTVTFGNLMPLRVATTPYNGAFANDTTPVRWGDYSQATVDPADPGVFWVTQEFALATNRWGTQSSEIIPTKAGQIRWQSAAAGSFSTGSNYFNGTAPTSTDHVIFSRWATASYQVDLAAGTTAVDRLSIRQTGTGTVTFNIASGSTLDLTNTSASSPSLAISEFQGTSNVVFSGGGTLQTRNTVIAGQAAGVGNLSILGSGTQWNNLNDVFLGGTSSSVGGTGTLTVNNNATATIGGTLQIRNNASSVTVGSAGNPATLIVGGLANNAGTNPTVQLANAGSLLRINGSFNTTFTGTITGSGQLDKQGTGTFTLTGNNTYSGGTTINNGTLLVNGQTGSNSGTGTGTVTIGSNGTLGGTGQVSGNVIVNGSIAPGINVGTLRVGNTTLASNGVYVWELSDANGAAGVGYDTLTQFGTNTLNVTATSADRFVLKLVTLNGSTPGLAANFDSNTAYTWTLGTFNSNTGNGVEAFRFDITGFANSIGQGMFSVLLNNGLLQVNFNPVPEPPHILLITALGAGTIQWIRRRRRSFDLVV